MYTIRVVSKVLYLSSLQGLLSYCTLDKLLMNKVLIKVTQKLLY